MVATASANAEKEKVADQVKFIEGDIFEQDFSEATVITLYLLPDVNLKLRPKILKLKPGTRIVSHAFNMGDWKPEKEMDVNGRDLDCSSVDSSTTHTGFSGGASQ